MDYIVGVENDRIKFFSEATIDNATDIFRQLSTSFDPVVLDLAGSIFRKELPRQKSTTRLVRFLTCVLEDGPGARNVWMEDISRVRSPVFNRQEWYDQVAVWAVGLSRINPTFHTYRNWSDKIEQSMLDGLVDPVRDLPFISDFFNIVADDRPYFEGHYFNTAIEFFNINQGAWKPGANPRNVIDRILFFCNKYGCRDLNLQVMAHENIKQGTLN